MSSHTVANVHVRTLLHSLMLCVHMHNNMIVDWPYGVSLSCLQSEYMKDFMIKIETWHKNDMGDQENVSHVIWQSYWPVDVIPNLAPAYVKNVTQSAYFHLCNINHVRPLITPNYTAILTSTLILCRGLPFYPLWSFSQVSP